MSKENQEVLDPASESVLQIIDHALGAVRAYWGSHQPNPEILYHYTNTDALFGIVESQSIWATHFEHLNDPSEVRYMTVVAHSLFRREIEASGLDPEKDDEIKTAKDMRFALLEGLLDLPTLTGDIAPYIACFSETSGVLGQWRAYAADGHGVAIGFKTAAIFEVVEQSEDKKIWPVLYDCQRQKAVILGIVDAVVEKLSESYFSVPADEDKLRVFRNGVVALRQLFRLLAPMMKHPAYDQEHEWRIVVERRQPESLLKKQHRSPEEEEQLKELKVRVGQGRIVPYLPVAFKIESGNCTIQHVVLGPAQDQVLIERSVSVWLYQRGLIDEIKLWRSSLPYRSSK